MLVKVGSLFKYLSWAKAKMYVVFLNLEFTSFVRETVSGDPDSLYPRELFTINLYFYFSFDGLALLFCLARFSLGESYASAAEMLWLLVLLLHPDASFLVISF